MKHNEQYFTDRIEDAARFVEQQIPGGTLAVRAVGGHYCAYVARVEELPLRRLDMYGYSQPVLFSEDDFDECGFYIEDFTSAYA